MFKLGTVDAEKISTSLNVSRIRVLLTKAMSDLKIVDKEPFWLSETQLEKKAESKTEPQSIEEIYQDLKKGYLVSKHSRNTKQPHLKHVYLSPDHKWLCWKSLDRQDQKKFAVTTIVKVVKQGFKNYIRDNLDLKNLNCCLLIVSTVRNLQLQTTSEYQADLVRYQLNRVLRNSREMCQNYLYHRK